MHSKKTCLVAACCFALALFLSVPAALASESQAVSLNAELGYGGAITYMREIPFTVTVTNNGPDVSGSLYVDLYRNAQEYDRYEMPLSMASGAVKRVVLPVKLKMKQDSFRIVFESNGTTLASVDKKPDRTINPEAVLIGVLSPDPQSVSYMSGSLSTASPDRSESWQPVPLNLESFPNTSSMMNSFMILLVDGFDVSTLSQEQQAVLDKWLTNGGIVLVGGGAQAATDYPWFAKYTNLAAGSLLPAEEITDALRQYAILDVDALGQPVILNSVTASAQPLVQGAHPLIYRSEAGSGLIYTAAFELGAKPLSSWSGMKSLWPRIVLKSGQALYSAKYSQLSSSVYGGYNNYSYLLDNLPVPNGGSTAPAIALLIGYLVLAGIGSYLLLCKLDKREWMWLTIPLMAVICVGGMFALGQALPFAKPVAVTLTTVQVDASGQETLASAAGIANPGTGETVIRPLDGSVLTPIDDDNYYVDQSDVSTAPITRTRKYRFLTGDQPSIGLPSGAAWTVRRFTVTPSQNISVDVSASLWMEDNGIHASITNNSPYTLRDCLVLTGMGYARLDGLAPGATATAAILKDEDGAQSTSTTPVSLYSTGIKAGQMISYTLTRSASWDLYPILQAAIYPEVQGDDQARYNFVQTLSAAEQQDRSFKENILSQLVNTDLSGKVQGTPGSFHFVAFTDEIGQTEFSLDGQTITRAGRRTVVDVLMNFQPIGPTGIVSYPPGMLAAYAAQLNGAGLPVGYEATPKTRNDYFQLADQPTFCYLLPDMSKLDISSLTIMMGSYDNAPVMRLYNYKTGTWDEQQLLYLSMTQAQAAPYVGLGGEMYVQFAPGAASRDYDGISLPAVALEGRLK